jgi:hypothetical protein
MSRIVIVIYLASFLTTKRIHTSYALRIKFSALFAFKINSEIYDYVLF